MVQPGTILKLAEIADQLESRGLHKHVNEIDRIILASLLQEAGIKENLKEIAQAIKSKNWLEVKQLIGKGLNNARLIIYLITTLSGAGMITPQDAEAAGTALDVDVPGIEETTDDVGGEGGIDLDVLADHIDKNVKGVDAFADKANDVLILRTEGENAQAKLNMQLQGWAQNPNVPRFEVIDTYGGSNLAMVALDFTGDKEVGSYDIDPEALGGKDTDGDGKAETPEFGLGEGPLQLDEKTMDQLKNGRIENALAKVFLIEGSTAGPVALDLLETAAEQIAAGRIMHSESNVKGFEEQPMTRLIAKFLQSQVNDAMGITAESQEDMDKGAQRLLDAFRQFKAKYGGDTVSDFK